MTNALIQFIKMGGYGSYVFSAYGIVFVFLSIQMFIPWRRWRRYLREQKKTMP